MIRRYVRHVDALPDERLPPRVDLHSLYLFLQSALVGGYINKSYIPQLGDWRMSFLAHMINERLRPERPLPTMAIPVPYPKPDVVPPAVGEFAPDPESRFLESLQIGDETITVVTAATLDTYARRERFPMRGYDTAAWPQALNNLAEYITRNVDIATAQGGDVRLVYPGLYLLGKPARWGIVPLRLLETIHALEADDEAREQLYSYRGIERGIIQRYLHALNRPSAETDVSSTVEFDNH